MWLKRILISLTFFFLVLFPKGGIKIGEIPITWGYILCFALLPFGFLNILRGQGLKVYLTKSRQLCLLLVLPFIVYSIGILLVSNILSVGYAISFVVSICLAPLVFLFFYNRIIDTRQFERFINNSIPWTIRLVACFGLALFFQRILTGNLFEIPFLTVNMGDVGMLDTKYNMRGNNIMKLSSTYNNGNIYGICMIMWMPFYLKLEKLRLFQLVFIGSLILTLSRTVWVGLLAYAVILVFQNLKSSKGWMILIFVSILVSLSTPILLELIGVDIGFLFDKKLGGRVNQLSVFNEITLFGNWEYTGIAEIVYTSILGQFGLIGLILFLIYIFAPVLIYILFNDWNKNGDPTFWGLLLYTLIALSDGAIMLIPVMIVYWFIGSFILRPNSDGNKFQL